MDDGTYQTLLLKIRKKDKRKENKMAGTREGNMGCIQKELEGDEYAGDALPSVCEFHKEWVFKVVGNGILGKKTAERCL